MASKSMAYDHPAYTVPQMMGGRVNGAAGAFKFSAFTAMQLKSVSIGIQTAGTSATDVVTAYKISGTSTTTVALATFTSGQTGGTNVTPASALTLAQNDVLALVKGADATADYGVTAEMAITPGANVTA